MASHFGHSKVTKRLVSGPFWDQKSVKNGSKSIFSKILLDYLVCTNKYNKPIWRPCGAIWAPLKAETALKMGQFGIKNGSKPWFPKNEPSSIVVP